MSEGQINHTAEFENRLQERMEDLLRASVSIQIKTILDLIEGDPHQWSSRPCQTCRAVSQLARIRFGCMNKS